MSRLVSELNVLLFPNLIYTLDNKLKLLKPFTFFHGNMLNCSKLESSVMCSTTIYLFIEVKSSISLILRASWGLVGIQTFLHRKHLHTHHTSSFPCPQKRWALSTALYKRRSLGWCCVGWVCVYVTCVGIESFLSVGKITSVKKPNTTTGFTKIFLDTRVKDFIWKKSLDLIELVQFSESSRDCHSMAEDKADAVGAGQGLQSEQLNLHQHNTADLAQERQRLPGLLGNTFEIRKREVYKVLQKTA